MPHLVTSGMAVCESLTCSFLKVLLQSRLPKYLISGRVTAVLSHHAEGQEVGGRLRLGFLCLATGARLRAEFAVGAPFPLPPCSFPPSYCPISCSPSFLKP